MGGKLLLFSRQQNVCFDWKFVISDSFGLHILMDAFLNSIRRGGRYRDIGTVEKKLHPTILPT